MAEGACYNPDCALRVGLARHVVLCCLSPLNTWWLRAPCSSRLTEQCCFLSCTLPFASKVLHSHLRTAATFG